MKEGPKSLYRFYDEAGSLLYVGITGHLAVRLTQHNASQAWWPAVANITVEHVGSMADALAAEQEAIDAERPAHNKYRAIGTAPMHSFRVPKELWDEAKRVAAEQGETVSGVCREGLEDYVRAGLG